MSDAFLSSLAHVYLWSYYAFCLFLVIKQTKSKLANILSKYDGCTNAKCADNNEKIEDIEALEKNNSRVYKPIGKDNFRLLKVLPGKRGSLLFVTLVEWPNLFAARYEALSYAWSKEVEEKKVIILNGQKFIIPRNLYSALQHLRDETLVRTFYIDAICINQSDEQERLKQVAMMGDIYKSAEHVINWIGPERHETSLGFEILQFLFGAEDLLASPLWKRYSAAKIRAALHDILSRPYFGRMWVVQENALARKITLMSGAHSMTWHSGYETHRAICRIKFTAISPGWEDADLRDIDFKPILDILEQNMMMTRMRMRRPCRTVTLLDQAYELRYRRATDRRDMLFALRNMMPDEMKDDFAVDYSTSLEGLYAAFFEAMRKAYDVEMDFVAKGVDKIHEEERKREEDATRRAAEPRRYTGGW